MTTRQIHFLRQTMRVLTLIACFCLNQRVTMAQTDEHNQMEIDPPAIPRYRKPKPAFVISADPAAKPLPLPPLRHEAAPEVMDKTPKPWVPTPAQLEKRRIRLLQLQERETAEELQRDRYVAIGKVVSLVLLIGLGIFALTDITRQVRKAKQAALQWKDDEDQDWEP